MHRRLLANQRGAAGGIILLGLLIGSVAVLTIDIPAFRGIRTAVGTNVDLSYVKDIPSKAWTFVTELGQNPFEEKTVATTEVSTKTTAGTGVKVVYDPKDRTGILSPNPRSQQDYTISVGIKNQMRDFVAKDSKLFLGNAGNLTNRTGLKFTEVPSPFVWDDGSDTTTIEPRGYKDYFSASAASLSTSPALKVTKTEEVAPTNIIMEVDYSYTFKSAYKLNLTGTPQNAINMYHAKFIVGSRLLAPFMDKIPDVYKLKDTTAGGPITVSRMIVEPYLEPGNKINLIFSLKNADANAGIFEAIEFKGDATGTSDKILLRVPKELVPSSGNVKDTCIQGQQYQLCKIKGLFPNSNIEDLKKNACTPEGCTFNNYAGFATANNYVLTDTGNEMGFTATFTVPLTMNTTKDTVYDVYLTFLEGAYTYHAAMTKGIGVQPG